MDIHLDQESIIQAISLIESNPELKKGRHSSTYDLIYEGKKYPPILVLSEANKLKGGEELTLFNFGNSTEVPFKILRDKGFEIRLKIANNKNAYIAWAKRSLTILEGTQQQYVTSLGHLSNIVGYNIFETADIGKIDSLYQDLLKEQKKVEGKYYEQERPSASLKGWYSAAVKTYLDFLKDRAGSTNLKGFELPELIKSISKAGLNYNSRLITRFTSSLLTKPFVILTGLTGSGKTKIAQSFAEWLCQDESQYLIVPVGADWTNREPLLGYPNGLDPEKYVLPDSGVLEFIIRATENEDLPYFLILDEMNLSHVERYFADFLSIMESGEEIHLHSDKESTAPNGTIIPNEIGWPENLFIIGTVNIDETTYMFSPKVLDRANVIEFRLKKEDLETYFNQNSVSSQSIKGEGAAMAVSFLELSKDKTLSKDDETQNELIRFFEQLSGVGAEFGYRSAKEILILTGKLKQIDPNISTADCIDIAVMQKLLPKLHGSRSKLIKVLDELIKLCVSEDLDTSKLSDETYTPSVIKYSLSYEKLRRMRKNAVENGFASYAEA